MTKDGQAERRLGNEDVAGDRLERSAGRVLAALVVAGHDHPLPGKIEDDLRAPEHMARRDEAYVDLTNADGLAIGNGSARLLAVARGHDRQRLGRRPDLRVSASGMVRMPVRDERLALRPRRIDPRISRADIDAFRKRLYPGTEARHRELYRARDATVPQVTREGGGKLHGRNHGWPDGDRRPDHPPGPAGLGGA